MNCSKLSDIESCGLCLRAISINDRDWITQLAERENSRSADFSFGSLFVWDKAYTKRVGLAAGRLAAISAYGRQPSFVFPIGGGPLAPAVDALRRHTKSRSLPFTLIGVTREQMEALESTYPGRFEFIPDRDYFDYVYLAEKLAELPGKKLHSKRTHINRFLEGGDWSLEPITQDSVGECLEMLEQWTLDNGGVLDVGLSSEHTAIQRAAAYFERLRLEGAMLRREGRVIAFTIGEKISSDTFVIHFEKAFYDVRGAYQMINREYARHILKTHPEIVYINREEDMGLENLRRAKLSYEPEFLVEKYTARWIEKP